MIPVFALKASRTFWNDSCSLPPHRDVTVMEPPAAALSAGAEAAGAEAAGAEAAGAEAEAPPPPQAVTTTTIAMRSADARQFRNHRLPPGFDRLSPAIRTAIPADRRCVARADTHGLLLHDPRRLRRAPRLDDQGERRHPCISDRVSRTSIPKVPIRRESMATQAIWPSLVSARSSCQTPRTHCEMDEMCSWRLRRRASLEAGSSGSPTHADRGAGRPFRHRGRRARGRAGRPPGRHRTPHGS